MLRRRAILTLSVVGVVSCGSVLGLNEDDDDRPDPPASEGGRANEDGVGDASREEGGQGPSDVEGGVDGAASGQTCVSFGDTCGGNTKCCGRGPAGRDLRCIATRCADCVQHGLGCELDTDCCPNFVCRVNISTVKGCCLAAGSPVTCKLPSDCCSNVCVNSTCQ